MGRPLDTKKLLKQCQKMSAKQRETAPSPATIPIYPKREEALQPMSPVELEQYLTQFLNTARDAQRRYEEAVALELLPNESIQDILHAAEFAPSTLANVDVPKLLHDFRTNRRTAKQELEITGLFKAWSDENKAALNKLENVLGEIRKVLRWQTNPFYNWKTNTVGEKGKTLIVDPKEGEDETN